MNVSVTNVAARRSASVNFAEKTLWPQLKAIYSRRKCVLYNLDKVYSPGQRRKKYAIIIMSHSAWRMEYLEELTMLEI